MVEAPHYVGGHPPNQTTMVEATPLIRPLWLGHPSNKTTDYGYIVQEEHPSTKLPTYIHVTMILKNYEVIELQLPLVP
jgi:hypothetical protein